jgi:hypothetical protein
VTIVDPANAHTWTIETLANDAALAGFADGPVAAARFRQRPAHVLVKCPVILKVIVVRAKFREKICLMVELLMKGNGAGVIGAFKPS